MNVMPSIFMSSLLSSKAGSSMLTPSPRESGLIIEAPQTPSASPEKIVLPETSPVPSTMPSR
jgi:hypothetical protein